MRMRREEESTNELGSGRQGRRDREEEGRNKKKSDGRKDMEEGKVVMISEGEGRKRKRVREKRCIGKREVSE